MLKDIFFFLRKENFRSYLTFNINKTLMLILILLLYILLFFQPFGLHELPNTLLVVISVGYCIMSILGYCVSVIVFRPLKKKKWSIFNEFIAYTSCLIFIWLLIYMYAVFSYIVLFPMWSNPEDQVIIREYFFFRSCLYTLVIGYIVYVLIQIYYSFFFVKSNNETSLITISDNMLTTNKSTPITIEGKNKNEKITINQGSFVCINSKGHYLDIFYLCEASHSLKRKTFRNSLKNVEFQLLDFLFIYRCHNSYVININLLKSVSGNSHQAYANIRNYPEKIPISQNKISYMQYLIKNREHLKILIVMINTKCFFLNFLFN